MTYMVGNITLGTYVIPWSVFTSERVTQPYFEAINMGWSWNSCVSTYSLLLGARGVLGWEMVLALYFRSP